MLGLNYLIKYMRKEKIKNSLENLCYIQNNNLKKIILKSTNVDIIGSYLRTWIDKDRIPYKYEFKTQDGSYFYYNPQELEVK